MPSQPPPGSTGESPRIPAPFQPAPDSTGGSPRTPAPFQPAPGSTGGSARTAVALSAQAAGRDSRKSTVLVDWCLERVEGEEGKIRVAGSTWTLQMSSQIRKGASSSKGKGMARRVFRSSPIVKRLGYQEIESEDGYRIWLHNVLNIPKTRENGFSQEVCECFELGFPIQWQRLVNPKMVPDNEHAQSPSETTTSAPSHSVEYYMAKFLSDSFSSSFRYDSTENDFDSSVGCSGNTDGLATQSLSNLMDDNAGNITASWGYGLRMDVPEKPLAPHGKACNSGQESCQHESVQRDSVNLGTTDALEVPSEHGIVTLPIDCTSSQLGEPGISKSRKDSVNLGSTDALELPTEGMTPNFGAIQGSEGSTGRRLRSGKVLGMPSGGPMKKCHKQKEIHQEASSKQMVNQGATSTSTADLTSHGNGFSAAEVIVEEKLESNDEGQGRPAKGKGKRKR